MRLQSCVLIKKPQIDISMLVEKTKICRRALSLDIPSKKWAKQSAIKGITPLTTIHWGNFVKEILLKMIYLTMLSWSWFFCFCGGLYPVFRLVSKSIGMCQESLGSQLGVGLSTLCLWCDIKIIRVNFVAVKWFLPIKIVYPTLKVLQAWADCLWRRSSAK